LSWAHIFDYQNRWTDNLSLALRQAKENAQLAIAKDASEPFGHFVAALAALFEQDFDRAQSEADQALSLNPNYAMAYNTLGSVRTFSGRPLEAIPLIEKAMRLDPAYGQQYQHFLGVAYLLAGKYETAAAILTQRILLVPGSDFSRSALASALGHLGEFEQARRVWGELKEINPQYTFKGQFGRQPFKNKSDLQRIADGLVAAGLPTD